MSYARVFARDGRAGIRAPLRRASERPIAIACLRLVTFFLDRPLLRVPRLYSRMTLVILRFPRVFVRLVGIQNSIKNNNSTFISSIRLYGVFGQEIGS